jgi:oxygen-independent coproporphyrinogen-3 oxidase
MAAVHAGDLPIWRGLSLSTEDRLRRSIIESIMCRGELRFAEYEHRYGVDFSEHFASELSVIAQQQQDGLLDLDEDGFTVTPAGRLLLRNTAMVFDEYLQRAADERQFSRVI